MNAAVTIDAVASALRYIPSDDRETWLKLGMAVKSALGEDGFRVWDQWSQTGRSYNERDARAVWRSIGSGRIGLGTLFYLAKAHGYRPGETRPQGHTTSRSPLPAKRDMRELARRLWAASATSDRSVATHPYAISKGITHAAGAGRTAATGRVIGRSADCIVVPLRDLRTAEVMPVQCINCIGEKQTFGGISGYTVVLGNTLDKAAYWCVCEGWASAVSMVFHHLKGHGVAAVAFGKSNLDRVAQLLADIYQPNRIHVIHECDD